MFRLTINGETITFESEAEMMQAAKEAQDKGLSIEDAREEIEEQPEDISKAPESAFSQVMSGKVPEVEEDFIQDPAKSADAVSETVAQKDTELPSVSTSSDLQKTDEPLDLVLSAEEMEANEDYWKEQEKSFLRQQAAEMEFSEKLKVDWYKGNLSLGEMLSSIPETIYDISAIPQNIIADAFDIPSLKATSDTAKETFGIENSVLNYYIAEQEKLGEVQAAYNEANYSTTGISANFSKGNYEDGFKQLASGLIESAPISLAMMAGGAVATTGQLVAGSTVAFAGPEIREQRGKSPEQSELATMAKSLGLAAAESVFSSIGTGTIGKVYKDIILKEGVKKGSVVFKEGLVKMYQTALTKYGAPISMVGEGVEEVATTITQNMINGKNPFENVTDSFIQGIGGGFAFGAPINAAKLTGALNEGITDFKIKKQLNDSDFNNVIEAFTPGAEINSSVINISQVNGSLEAINRKADKEVVNGNITQDQADAVKKNAAVIQGATASVERSNVSEADKSEAVELLTERNNLKREIDAIGDKTLAGPQELRLNTVNELLGKLVRKGAGEKAAISTASAKKIITELGNAKFTEAKNRSEIDARLDEINNEDPDAPDIKYDNQYGLIIERANGETEIIINQEETFKDGIVNTAAHEVLHFALQNTLKSSLTEDTQIKVGDALIDFLETIEKDTNLGAFENRFLDYIDAFKKGDIKRGDLAEEAITVLSEAMLNGQVKYTETLGTKLMDFGRRLASALGYKAKFNTGQDVFNFIRDYNNSIKKGGKLSKGLKKSLKEGVKGKLTKTETTEANKKQSVKPSLTTNKVDTALDALEEAEALRDEDYDNPTLAANVEKALAVYNQALIEAENLEEDAAIETAEEATKEKIVRPKADKTKRRYSLDPDVKKEIEPKIAEAQAMNKKLIAQEKELNKKLIADIEAIPDKEVKRTEKDKRINALKNNPRRVAKSPDLNKLERQISKELKTPIDKAVNLFTKLYYDKISDNAKTAVTRDEFKESARAEITSITINEFKPKTINRQGESVVNDIEDIIFQRGGLRLRSLAERLGVVGKDQGIARGAEALIKMADSSSDINFDENDKDSIRSEEKRKVSALLASAARTEQAKQQVKEFWIENEGNTKVENFKKLPNLINNILAEMFGVTEGTLTARSGNLNKADYANAIKAFTEKQAVFTVKEGDDKKEVRVPVSEVSAFQDSLNEKKAENKDFSYKREANESIAEALLRFLPQTSADDYTYASGRKGRFSGKSTGLPKNLMGLAYKIDGRKTTGIGNVERTAQKLTIEEIYDAIGAGFDADGNVVQKMGLSGKNKEGQTMLGLIKLLGRMVTNELSRTETDLDPMTKMDIAAGKNRLMHSLKIERGLKQGLGVEVNTNLSEGNLNNTRNLFKDISEELGSQGTVDYLVPLISRGYGTYYTKNGKVFFEPGRFSIFKNREDFFSNIDIDDFKDFKSGDRKVVINDADITLKINFDQNAKNLNKFADQITERQEFAKDQRKGLNKIAKILKSKLEEDFEGNKDAVASVLQTMNSNVDGLIRTAAVPEFMFLETNETNYVYEHSKTASDTLVELSQLIFSTDSKVDFDKEFNEIMSDFVVSIIPKSYDNILNEVFKSNGPREGDKKSNYAKPLIKSKDGIPVRYTDQAFTSLLLKNGMAPMNVVPITKKGLQDHLSSVKSIKKLIKENTKLLPKNLRQEGITNNQAIKNVENFDKAITLGNSLDQPTRGISIWDFDDTLATTKSNVLYTMPDGTKGKLDASKFAKEGDTFLANGAEFDFSEFSKVMNGDKGPFFNKAVDRNRKFGNKDVYILTARPANSANAIHEFLKGIGLDIPLANITGLASSDPQAKANWVVSKFAEGYNDFYFADDHVGNVAAVGDALSRLDDVRSKVELAKAVKYSKKIRREYSTILDKLRGGDVIEGNKVFSAEQQIDDVFDWVKSLDIPEKNQAKYKKAALNFVAKSPTNFPVDAEIVGEAMRIAELKKLNVMDFSNPRDIIDKFAGEVKVKRLDPNKEKQFFNKKSLPEGIETFQVTTQRRGQQAVRRMLDTHWGEKANPWCVTVQEKTYTEAEKKELKINNPKYPIGTKDQMIGEEIMDKGVVIKSANTAPTDFVGNLMPGWVEGPTTYASTNYLDQLIIDSENEQEFDEELAQAKAQGYKVIEGSYDVDGDNFYVQVERNNDPKVNKVFKYTQYFKAIDPSLTQEEFNNGPAKGGTVYNPRIEATGPAELTSQSFQMWENYGKPINAEFVNEDTVAVEINDGGFEIAFKDGKLLALKNLGGTKQEWFDRMDHGTKDLALKVPRDAKGKINGKSTLMNTDSGRVFSKDYTVKYSKRIDRDINFLTNELSTKGEALLGQSNNLDAQPKAVKDVINTLDIKSKVQQARVKSSLQLSKRFNEIIEEESGIESFKEYQSVKAAKKGAKKGKFKFFVPPSAEDFLGLLYTTLPKGKKGESAMAFYKEHLLDPYGKAVTGLRTGRITIAKNYKALKKELGIVPRTLKKNFKYEDENGNMKESLFTKEDAIRVYTWDAQGLDIPGLSNVDLPILVNYVNSNPDLKAFADKLLGLNKNVDPKAPTESWPAGTITSDLLNTLNTDGRKQLLEVWQQNVDAIFTATNLNKLEAAYGKPYVTALKDSLRRMRTGRNSTPTNNGVTDGIVRWLNAAVGNIMFLNRRSAVLQLISFTNFINFEGNNLYQAGKAFANQPQYWKDWVYLMNSDYLVDRRDGLKINVNEADIATTAKENGFQGVLAKILQVGFIPTKMADSAAIATGGASFYRNRVNALIKGGMSKAAAEKQAMQDFVATAEVSQQSSDPSKISKQQAEPIGRIILAFANTPSQYARIIKRAAQDLKNGRGDAKTHLSRIVYYGVLQNVVFNFLQQAMFAAMMGDDEDESEEDTAAKSASETKKAIKVANSMTDGILRGIGVAGAVVSVAKNLAIKLYERSQKTRNQNLAATIKDEVMKISPPISSKLSKAGKVGNAFEWGKKEIEFDKMSLKHPYVTAATNTVAALTGLPLDRAQGMAIDAVDIASDETETWMKPLIALGWPKWQLMSEEDTKAEREKAKERFKELKEDKEYDELNPTEKRRKALKDLSRKEQVDMLWNAGVSRTEIKGLSKEADRIDKLMDIQNKEQFDKDMEAISRGEEIGEPVKIEKPKKEKKKYSPAMEKRRKVLKDLSKQEQVDSLWNRGLSKSEIRELTSEESRINKIIELQNKKRKNSLK